MVAKVEKSYKIAYGVNLSAETMDNQQESSEQENLQRPFRKEVGYK